MIIETWVATLLLVGICILGGIGLLGWIVEGQRHDETRKESQALVEENRALVEENAKLKSKLSLVRLYINLEEKK